MTPVSLAPESLACIARMSAWPSTLRCRNHTLLSGFDAVPNSRASIRSAFIFISAESGLNRRDRKDAREKGDQKRREHKLPHGDSGGARDDEFKPAGKVDEGRHGAEQHGEREYLLGDGGYPQ